MITSVKFMQRGGATCVPYAGPSGNYGTLSVIPTPSTNFDGLKQLFPSVFSLDMFSHAKPAGTYHWILKRHDREGSKLKMVLVRISSCLRLGARTADCLDAHDVLMGSGECYLVRGRVVFNFFDPDNKEDPLGKQYNETPAPQRIQKMFEDAFPDRAAIYLPGTSSFLHKAVAPLTSTAIAVLNSLHFRIFMYDSEESCRANRSDPDHRKELPAVAPTKPLRKSRFASAPVDLGKPPRAPSVGKSSQKLQMPMGIRPPRYPSSK